jgi:DNA polymerase-3 subunit alpha
VPCGRARGGGSEPAAPAKPANGAAKTNGNGHGNGNGNGHSAPRATPLASAAAAPLPARMPAATGFGNNSALRETRPALGASPAAGSEPPRRVTVTVQTSGDKDRDKRRMRRLHGLLTSYPGQDQFEFSVQDYNDQNYLLRFPNDTTGYCPPLGKCGYWGGVWSMWPP